MGMMAYSIEGRVMNKRCLGQKINSDRELR